jgi:hypothetical protein
MAYLFKKPQDESKALQTPQQFSGGATTQNQTQQKIPTDVAGGAGQQIMQGNKNRGVDAVSNTLLKPVQDQTRGVENQVAKQEDAYRTGTQREVSKIGGDYDSAKLPDYLNTGLDYLKGIMGYVPQVNEGLSFAGNRNTVLPEAIKQGTVAENLQRTKKYGTGLANIDSALFGGGKNYGNVVAKTSEAQQRADKAIAGMESGALEKDRLEQLKRQSELMKSRVQGDLLSEQDKIKFGLQNKAAEATDLSKRQVSESEQLAQKRLEDKFNTLLQEYASTAARGGDYSKSIADEVIANPTIKQIFQEKLPSYIQKGEAATTNWEDLLGDEDLTKLQNISNILGEPMDYKQGAGSKAGKQAISNEELAANEIKELLHNATELAKARRPEAVAKPVIPQQPIPSLNPADAQAAKIATTVQSQFPGGGFGGAVTPTAPQDPVQAAMRQIRNPVALPSMQQPLPAAQAAQVQLPSGFAGNIQPAAPKDPIKDAGKAVSDKFKQFGNWLMGR